MGMVRNLVISTVGASLLNNFKKSKGLELFHLENAESLISSLVEFIGVQGEEKASSETNSISKTIAKIGLDARDTHLTFICSETKLCSIASSALKQYFEERGFTVSIEVIKDLNYDEAVFQSSGLRNFVNKLIDLVSYAKKEKFRVILNATPGFKAESAFMAIIGMLFNCETFYIHERFKNIIKFHPLPLSLDLEIWKKHSSALQDLPMGIEKEKFLERWSENVYNELSIFIEEENGFLKLSPLGIIYYRFAKWKEKI